MDPLIRIVVGSAIFPGQQQILLASDARGEEGRERQSTLEGWMNDVEAPRRMWRMRMGMEKLHQHHSERPVMCVFPVRPCDIQRKGHTTAAALRIVDHSSAEPSVGLHFPLMVRDLFNFQSHKSLLRSSILTFVILWPLHLLLRHQCQWQWQHLNTWRPGRQAMGYFIGGAGG